MLPVIGPDEALRLTAIIDHKDGDVDRLAGDMWQLEGPLTYYPTPYATFAVSTKKLTNVIVYLINDFHVLLFIIRKILNRLSQQPLSILVKL